MNIEDTLRNAVRQLEADKARLNSELNDARTRELNAKEAEKDALRKLDEVKRDLASRTNTTGLRERIVELERELKRAVEKKDTETFEPHDLKKA
jgi:septation ring formation regulator EzrA